ncbi:hypothetical protein ACWD3J_16900 [Streptomyces sp. NPDC002755]
MTGKTAQGWMIVQSKRAKWREEYDGVFLGERDGMWIAGRMFLGKSMRDGFTESGEWRGATQFTDPAMHEAYRAHLAVQDYIRQAEDAGDCWDGMFNQQAQAAIDRHWAGRGASP